MGRTLTGYVWGRLSGFGLAIAVLAVLADQASKLWVLFGYGLAGRGEVTVTKFLDLVLIWNEGISYGLFQQDGYGRYVLVVLAGLATIAFLVWLATLEQRLAAAAIGLVIGGAIGNAIDRLAYGAVVDFISLHAYGYHWYVFNVADVAIVAGVIGLIWFALFPGHTAGHKTVSHKTAGHKKVSKAP